MGSVVVRTGGKCRQMRSALNEGKQLRSNSKKWRSKVVQLRSVNSVNTYRVNFSPTDRDGILTFACPHERTEREEAERRDRAEEDRKKAEAAHRPKQADEEQQQKVTFQSCAVRVFQFCACISR